MLETRHHWLPIIIAVYLPVSFIITYSIAVGNDHVEPGFPYISDTGTHSPESCVFGQLLNIGAAIAGVIIYIRYRHCLYHFNGDQGSLLKLNTAALVIGILTIFGVSLVGNFQETNVLAVHLIGAFLAFAVGFVYMVLQTIITYKSTSFNIVGNTLFIRRFRLVLCIVDVILLLILGIASSVARTKGPGAGKSKQLWSPDEPNFASNMSMYLPILSMFPSLMLAVSIMTLIAASKWSGPVVEMYEWTSDQPGYGEHLASTISEWLVAIVTVIYFATFYKEFKHFRMKPPEVVYYEQQQQQPGSTISVITS